MQRPKSMFLFLIFLSVMLVTIILAKVFPPYNKELPEEIQEEDFISIDEDLDTHSPYKKIDNGFVEETPIALDDDIKKHLNDFRNKANRLAKRHPDTFFTCGTISERVVALTFDDGPDNITTPEILDILDRHDAPATFFLIGENVEKFPHVCENIISSGHQVANHSFSHARPTDISVEEALNEFEKCNTMLNKILKQSVNYIRPPYGLVTENQLDALKDSDFKVIGWSIDSMDWYTEDRDEIIECVIDSIHPGAIVLMHSKGGNDNRKATVESLPIIIETLKEQGYSFVTVEQLLGE